MKYRFTVSLTTGFKGLILFLMCAGTSNWSYHIKNIFCPRSVLSYLQFGNLLLSFRFIPRYPNLGRNTTLSLTFLIFSASMATISRLFLSSSRSANLSSKDSLSFCNSLHSSLACFAWDLTLSRYSCNPMIILSKSLFSASFVAIWPAEMQNKFERLRNHTYLQTKQTCLSSS